MKKLVKKRAGRNIMKIKTAYNRRLAKKRVQWLNEHPTSYQLLCWADSLVLRNPLLRQAPKRYLQPQETPYEL